MVRCSRFSPPAALKDSTFGAFWPVVFKIWSACGAEEGHFGPSGPKVLRVFEMWSACGAIEGHTGPFGPRVPVVFKIWSACGAEENYDKNSMLTANSTTKTACGQPIS